MREIRLFGHYLSLPLIVLSGVDVLVVGTVVFLAADDALAGVKWPLVVLAMIGATIAFVGKAAVGLYHMQSRVRFTGIVMRMVVAFLIGLPVMIGAGLMLPVRGGQLAAAVAAGTLAYGLLGVLHAGFFALADAGALRRRILILGAGESATALLRLRRRADRRGFDLVGFVPMEEVSLSASPLMRPDKPLCRFARELRIDEIVVALDERRNVLPLGELVECRFRGISIVELATFVEREVGIVRLDLLRPGWMVFEGNRAGRFHEMAKRALDVCVSVMLLVVTFPITAVTVAAIMREDGLDARWIYRQSRVGKDGQVFELLKFRSMREDAEADGRARWAAKDDDRITRVGRWIRVARIDELPQLWNVLRGDMSLVGPRPERPEFVSELEQHIPFYGERHRIKPGVTGWAQVLYPYGASQEDAAKKLEYDLYYLKNRSLLLDVIILIQTVEVVLFGKGAR